MMIAMKVRFLLLILAASLGIWGCHGDAGYATDLNSTLLQDSTTPITTSVTFQGSVSCAGCDPAAGMAIVVTSATMGIVAHAMIAGTGSYSLVGTAKPSDTLTMRLTVVKNSQLVGKGMAVVVPPGGGVITQNFEF